MGDILRTEFTNFLESSSLPDSEVLLGEDFILHSGDTGGIRTGAASLNISLGEASKSDGHLNSWHS